MDYYKKKSTDLWIHILDNERLHLFSLYTLSILIPVLIKGPQVVVGTLINMILLMGVTRFPLKKVFPILFLPSITSYVYGLLLGSATLFLLYLIPFISISNFIYISLFEKIENRYLKILLPPITKASFLYFSTYILYLNIGLPKILLTSMGIMQLITASIATVSVVLLLERKTSN